MRRMGMWWCAVALGALLGLGSSAVAGPITLTGFDGYGYNTLSGGTGYDGQPGAIGCGPTSGAMILNYYFGLTNPLAEARAMGSSTYMNVNLGGFGSSAAFGPALEAYAADVHGQHLELTLHVEPTSYDPSGWASSGYDTTEIVDDATFWADTTNFQTLNETAFLNFIQAEIDAGNPMVATVDSDGDGGTDHWMMLVGYDRDAGKWAGYNTWDSSLHWYDIDSAFRVGNTMGIGYLRTIEYLGAIDGGTNGDNGNGTEPVPEPSTIVLLAVGVAGFALVRRRHRRS